MASNKEAMVQLRTSDGFTLDAFEASAGDKRIGGVVILQEIFGVTDQLKSVARNYAKEGFDAIVPALFDRAAPKTVIPFDQGDRGRETMMGLDKAKTMLDIAAAVEHLSRGKGGVSVMGFCWGGGLALSAACELTLTSAVSFYGTMLQNRLGKPPKCPILFHFGATDTHSPPEVIEAVKKAIPSAETYTYEAGHAFANDARPNFYVKDAGDTAHARTLAFLRKAHTK
ncbi:MAG: dienelactone hydrolase family protein [Gammaproteobacteria bacterium]|nr:dienelactone hydrolase family protein [Gammaproteobacteria bacterium]